MNLRENEVGENTWEVLVKGKGGEKLCNYIIFKR